MHCTCVRLQIRKEPPGLSQTSRWDVMQPTASMILAILTLYIQNAQMAQTPANGYHADAKNMQTYPVSNSS